MRRVFCIWWRRRDSHPGPAGTTLVHYRLSPGFVTHRAGTGTADPYENSVQLSRRKYGIKLASRQSANERVQSPRTRDERVGSLRREPRPFRCCWQLCF